MLSMAAEYTNEMNLAKTETDTKKRAMLVTKAGVQVKQLQMRMKKLKGLQMESSEFNFIVDAIKTYVQACIRHAALPASHGVPLGH